MSAASVSQIPPPLPLQEQAHARPHVRGKFIYIDARKFYIKGVTYGAFRPNETGVEFHDLATIRRDFAMMAANGVNTVRIPHTTPPPHLLDIAAENNLLVMAGLSGEQYVGYLLDGKEPYEAFSDISSKVRSCREHPALLCYALGNEIPAAVARWLGRKRIEHYLHSLYKLVKVEDPDALVTYVNYPSTEYLQLPFLDFYCFNVYVEHQERLEAYLARLQNIAVDRPLVMSELGLDGFRNGAETQAEVLDWQIRTTFEAGCAGAVVFSWTDEWHRGGGDVMDWEFGLTDRDRKPKPALAAVRRAFEGNPFPKHVSEPLISVVVCSYNGARTIAECLHHSTRLKYSNYEVIVVDDGSTDDTPEIARRFDVHLISTENRGLSAARNTGLERARGEFVAYIDDDAYPDADWLTYLASAFQRFPHALVGGPNLSPPDDPLVAQCVALSPGGPSHVLLTDTIAEHVPGCNMAFRKSCLEEIGGFDPRFRAAGDDVDICWRIQEKGWTVGFAPAALVWHHRRSSIRAYWKQQRGYGKAEALLQEKWPDRFNASNHLPWAGRLYHPGIGVQRVSRSVIYHGMWGEAPFQRLYGGTATLWDHLLEVPELYLMNAALALLSALGLWWSPMLAFSPFLGLGILYPLVRATAKARHVYLPTLSRSRTLSVRVITGALHVTQPLARLCGRLQHGLTPWKRRGCSGILLPYRRQQAQWTEGWIDPHERLCQLERSISGSGFTVWRGNAYEVWDLKVVGGLWASTKVLMAVEDHGSGRQYVRAAAWPCYSMLTLILTLVALIIAFAAIVSGQLAVAILLAGTSLLLFGGAVLEAGRSMSAVVVALKDGDRAVSQNLREDAGVLADASPGHASVAVSDRASSSGS